MEPDQRRPPGPAPRIQDGRRLSVYLPADLLARLEEVAQRRRITRGELIRRALASQLSRTAR